MSLPSLDLASINRCCDCWPTQPKCTVRLTLIVKRRASVLIPPFPEAVESSKSEPRQSWQKFFPFASPILPTPASNLRPSLGRPSNASPLPTATPLNRAKISKWNPVALTAAAFQFRTGKVKELVGWFSITTVFT